MGILHATMGILHATMGILLPILKLSYQQVINTKYVGNFMESMLKEPTQRQLNSIAEHIKDELLPRWDIADIGEGIKRVRTNEVGIVSDVYFMPGMFATLCHWKFGNRTRKPFGCNGFMVRQWRPKGNAR